MKKNHKCQIKDCQNVSAKDKYGNYKRYCSDDCKSKSEIHKNGCNRRDYSSALEKRKATNMEKYGVSNVSQTDAVKDKLRITTKETAVIRTQKTRINNLERYGVESTNSLESAKEKKKKSFIEKYGVDHQLKIPEVAVSVAKKNSENAKERLAKAKETNIEKYGCENPSSNDKVKVKRTETMVERFGVENASQNAEVHTRQMKPRYIEYKFPSGNIQNVMGYEPQALEKLLQIFNEEDIIIGKGNMPELWYDLNGKKRYFPDIYIPKENLIIEVKSVWTWSKDSGTLSKNKAKEKCVIDNGYKFLLMMFDNTGKKLLTEIKWK